MAQEKLSAVAARDLVAEATRQLVAERGEMAAIAYLGLSRQTVGRLAGGLSVHTATLIVAAARLGVQLAGARATEDGPTSETVRSALGEP